MTTPAIGRYGRCLVLGLAGSHTGHRIWGGTLPASINCMIG